MKFKKNTALTLILVISLSLLCSVLAVFTSQIAKANETLTYDQVSLSNLHTATLKTTTTYSSTKADITVLTHGLNSDASVWSNKGKNEFAYNENSIIEQIRNKNLVNLSVFKVKVNGNAINISERTTREQRKSQVLVENETSGKVESMALEGIYNSNNVSYNNSNNDNRKLELSKVIYSLSEYTFQTINPSNVFFTATDISNHIIIVFESTKSGESNDVVYSELEYVLDCISWEYKRVAARLPLYNLIGHSRGGLTNMQYALAHPNNVVSMYSMGTPYLGSNFGSASDFFIKLAKIGKGTNYLNPVTNLIEEDFSPGVLDILDEDISRSYSDCWNDNYSDYDHIKFTPIGSYVTFGFIVQTLIEYVVTNEVAKALLRTAAVAVEGVTGVLSLFTPEIVMARIATASIDWAKDILKEFVSIECPWLEILSGIRTSPVLETHIGGAFSFSLTYEDDLFIDLDSQLAKHYDGATVNRKVKLMDSFDQIKGQDLKAQPGAVGVGHNLETMNEDIVGFLSGDIRLGNADTSDAFRVKYKNDGYYITEILKPAMVIQNGILQIPSKIKGCNVTGIKSLSNEINSSTSSTLSGYNITQVNIPATVKEIGEYAFFGFTNLTTVTIEQNSNLEIIGEGAFAMCTSLSSFTLPNSIKILGKGAFAKCSALTTVVIGSNVETIYDGCFAGTGIASFAVDTANNWFSVINGVLYNKTGTILVAYPHSKQTSSFVLPSGVSHVGSSAFLGNTILTTINLSGASCIGETAFANCINLASISGNAVSEASLSSFENTAWYTANENSEKFGIGQVLFKYNGTAEEIDLREYSKIGRYAFVQKQNDLASQYAYNTTLKKVIVGGALTKLETSVFYNCVALEEIYIIVNQKISIDKTTFDGLSEELKVYVQNDLVEEYNQNVENDRFYPIKTTVNFYSGEEKVHEEYAYYGEVFESTFVPDTESEYRFDGWYDSTEYNSTIVGVEFDSFVSEVNVYAKIVQRTYSIMYFDNLDDGSWEQKYEYGEAIELKVITKDNFAFIGWYEDPDCNDPITESELAELCGDLLLYAKWSTNIVTFHSPVGTFLNESFPCFMSDVHNSSEMPIPLYGSAHFEGWYSQAQGQGEQIIDSQGNVLVANVPTDLYAKWETFTITYTYDKENVQTVENKTEYSYYDEDYELLSPTLDNYWFVSWRCDGKVYTHLTNEIKSDLVLLAIFSSEYELVFETNGGTACSNVTIEAGEPFTIPKTTKKGYHHEWKCNGQVYATGATFTFSSLNFDMTNGTLTFVSEWTAHEDYTGTCTYTYVGKPTNPFNHDVICDTCGYTKQEVHKFSVNNVGVRKCSKCKENYDIVPVLPTANDDDCEVCSNIEIPEYDCICKEDEYQTE